MADKRQILKDSVKKLISLNISDREIIVNLKDVGVSEEEAEDILEETKRELRGEKVPKEEEKKKEEEAKPTVYEEVLETFEEEKPKEKVEKAMKEFEKAAKEQARPVSSVAITELWEKGILATLDAKLGKMEKLKKEIDVVLDEKVKEATDKEVKRIEALMDAQKTLLVNKVETSLAQRTKEVTDVIDSRIDELKKVSKLTEESLARLEEQKKSNEELMSSIDDRTASLEKVKSGLISDMNASLIQSQSKIETFLKESEKRRDEIDARINRTLQLESKITEGLLTDAQQKIDKMALEKSDKLAGEIRVMIREMKQTQERIDPKLIQSKLDKLEKLESQTKKLNEARLAELRKGNELQLDELFNAQKAAWAKELKTKEKEIDHLKGQIDLEKINTTVQDLDVFKRQFIKVIEKNVAEFNKARRKLAELMRARDMAIEDRLKAIDMKMVELTEFEKNFAAEMGLAIDNLVTKKPQKKEKPRRKKKK